MEAPAYHVRGTLRVRLQGLVLSGATYEPESEWHFWHVQDYSCLLAEPLMRVCKIDPPSGARACQMRAKPPLQRAPELPPSIGRSRSSRDLIMATVAHDLRNPIGAPSPWNRTEHCGSYACPRKRSARRHYHGLRSISAPADAVRSRGDPLRCIRRIGAACRTTPSPHARCDAGAAPDSRRSVADRAGVLESRGERDSLHSTWRTHFVGCPSRWGPYSIHDC